MTRMKTAILVEPGRILLDVPVPDAVPADAAIRFTTTAHTEVARELFGHQRNGSKVAVTP